MRSGIHKLGKQQTYNARLLQNNLYSNAIINGDFRIARRFTNFSTFTAATDPANDDDTYLFDRWILLSDGNDIVDVSRNSDVPSDAGCAYSQRAVVQTINKKFGFFQPIEEMNSLPFMNKQASISFWARTETGAVINNIRAAIVSWSSTADSITSDIISAWGASGTNPTLATNWTYENTASNLALSTDWNYYTIEDISIDTTNMANLGLFIWVDDTDCASADELYLTGITLNEGSFAKKFQPRQIEIEDFLCLRYFFSRNQSEHSYAANPYLGQAFSTTAAVIAVGFPCPMRIIPTRTVSGAGHFSVTQADLSLNTLTSISDLTGGLHDSVYSNYMSVAIGAANLVAGNSSMFLFNNASASAFLRFDAEL